MTTYSPPFSRALDEACEGLLEDPSQAWIAICARPFGIALTLEPFVQGNAIASCYADATAFAADVAAREPRLVTFAPELLARFDVARGIVLARRTIALEASAPLDAHVRASARRALEGLAARLPLDEIVALAAEHRYFQPDVFAHPEVQSPEAYHRVLDLLDRAPKSAPAWFSYTRLALFGRLFDAADETALARAVAIWNDPAHSLSDQIGTFLWPRNDARAFEAMAARAEELADDPAAPLYQRQQSEAALMMLGRADAYAALVLPRRLDPNRLTSEESVASANRTLSQLEAYVQAGKFPTDHRPTIDAAVLLLGNVKTARAARSLVSALDKKAVKAALDGAGVGKKAVRPTVVAVPARLDFLERYEAGEHVAVWKELDALGATVNDPKVLPVALDVARATMARVAQNLEAIVRVLRKSKYALDLGKKAIMPAKDAEKKLAALEKVAAGPLPISVRAFYERFERVSLAEKVDAMTDACELDGDLGRWDPLVVLPLTIGTKDLKAQAGANKALIAALRSPLRLYVAPTTHTKYDPESEYPDEAPGCVTLEARMDGALNEGDRPPIAFVDWLRSYIQHGGFRKVASAATEATLTADLLPF